jgi:hypothetical protein
MSALESASEQLPGRNCLDARRERKAAIAGMNDEHSGEFDVFERAANGRRDAWLVRALDFDTDAVAANFDQQMTIVPSSCGRLSVGSPRRAASRGSSRSKRFESGGPTTSRASVDLPA